MKVALVLLSSLALVAPARRYPGGGGGGGFHRPGGRYPNSGGGGQIVFPGQPGHVGGGGQVGGGAVGGGHIHGDDDHGHGIGGGSGGIFGQVPEPIGHFGDPLYRERCTFGNSLVHDSFNGHSYHFSWCNDGGQRYTWQRAKAYCEGLGAGWYPVAIETVAENDYIIDIVASHRSPWIWTGGSRLSNGKVWQWTDGRTINYFDWGQTGSLNRPQPDNAENNNEQCLSILNQFYRDRGDFISWHDIGCHHEKPTICELSRGGSQVSVPQYG